MRIAQWELFKISKYIIKLALLSIFFLYTVQLVIHYTNICKAYHTSDNDIQTEQHHDGVHVLNQHKDGIHMPEHPHHDAAGIHIVEERQDAAGIHIVEDHHDAAGIHIVEDHYDAAGIHIVEEHHHVWPVWSQYKPPIVVHIDAHPDTAFNGEDPPNQNDVFIYLATREKWLKTVIWIWPDWDAKGPRHSETGSPVTNYTGYWGIWKNKGFGKLWTSTKGFCLCETETGEEECGSMEEEIIENEACLKIEGTEFEVFVVSTKEIIENPGWLEKKLGGQPFILDFDLDYAAALNNPMGLGLEISLETIATMISPIFTTSRATECDFHQNMMKQIANIHGCNKTPKTEIEQIICSAKNPDIIRKKMAEWGFCVRDKVMQVCSAQGSEDVSKHWRRHLNQSLADLGRLVSIVYEGNAPVAVTICRSVRDGYTPAYLAPRIEQTVLAALQSQGSKPVFYDRQLWCGEKGPGLPNSNLL